MLTHTTLAAEPDLKVDYDEIAHTVWPEYIFHDVNTLKYWARIEAYFPEFQMLFRHRNEVIGFANSVPIRWDLPLTELPQQGWDWLLERSVEDYENGRTPNLIAGLNISLRSEFQGRGLSYQIISALKERGRFMGFPKAIFPVRPSKKHLHPRMTMKEYLGQTNEKGEIFDPWLRAHLRLGGIQLHTCNESMLIIGTFKEWELWSKQKLKAGSEIIVPGGLVPVTFDKHSDTGTYLEPNVWVTHKLIMEN